MKRPFDTENTGDKMLEEFYLLKRELTKKSLDLLYEYNKFVNDPMYTEEEDIALMAFDCSISLQGFQVGDSE